eukprot:m.233429 g.233429  ORF g.233429 m.233429 type:complete len:870 (-) comp16027_c0_seq1:181-2790(-)
MFSCALLLLLASTSSGDKDVILQASGGLQVTVTPEGSYTFQVDGNTWLTSHPSGGVSTTKGQLQLASGVSHVQGDDENLGAYEGVSLLWSTQSNPPVQLNTTFRAFKTQPIVLLDLIFPQEMGIEKSSGIGQAFPIFQRSNQNPPPSPTPALTCKNQSYCVVPQSYCGGNDRHQLPAPSSASLGDCMKLCDSNKDCNCFSFKQGSCRPYTMATEIVTSRNGYTAYVKPQPNSTSAPSVPLKALWHSGSFPDATVTSWNGKGVSISNSGLDGSPLVLFNEAGRTLTASPYGNYMATGHGQDKDKINMGVMGSVELIPAGYKATEIFIAGQGMRSSMMAWGNTLLKKGKKTRTAYPHPTDMSMNTLGYWTDNGAFYHYNPCMINQPQTCPQNLEGNKTYEDVMLAVKKDWLAKGLPVQYFMYDSWWYPKVGDPPNAPPVRSGEPMIKWEPVNAVFPDGLSDWLGLPVFLHARIYADNNTYRSMGYKMICDGFSCLPQDPDMFKYLMGKVKNGWNAFVYEQDWMNKLTGSNEAVLNSTTHGRQWLMAMGDAALSLNMTIQYCMEEMPHLLQSTEIQAVSQARASGDYFAGSDSWKIGRNAQLYWAIGIVPSKDTFQTNFTQPGCPHEPKCTEPNVDLVTLVSTLSLGPVGPGDRLTWENVSLIKKTCRSDGILMRPDRPMLPVDKTFTANFQQSDDNEIVLWETETQLLNEPGTPKWHYVLSVDPDIDLTLTTSDIEDAGHSFIVYDHFTKTFSPDLLEDALPFNVTTTYSSGLDDSLGLSYLLLAPLLPNSKFALLGEVSKFVSTSARRFVNVVDGDGKLSATVIGAPQESVTVSFVSAVKMAIVTTQCELSSMGKACAECSNNGCTCTQC